MRGLAARMMLGKLKFIRGRDAEWKRAIKKVHNYIDAHVTRVLSIGSAAEQHSPEKTVSTQKQYTLLNEMAKETQDPIDLRYQLLHVFIPAHDATGIAVSDIFFHLARDWRCWNKLRAEILDMTLSQPLSFEVLKSMKYLRYVFNESMSQSSNSHLFDLFMLRGSRRSSSPSNGWNSSKNLPPGHYPTIGGWC